MHVPIPHSDLICQLIARPVLPPSQVTPSGPKRGFFADWSQSSTGQLGGATTRGRSSCVRFMRKVESPCLSTPVTRPMYVLRAPFPIYRFPLGLFVPQVIARTFRATKHLKVNRIRKQLGAIQMAIKISHGTLLLFISYLSSCRQRMNAWMIPWK